MHRFLRSFPACAVAGLAVVGAAAAAPADPLEQGSSVRVLDDHEDFRDCFNEQSDRPRLVLLLSPICPHCLSGARTIRNDVVGQLEKNTVRVIVVWEPMLPGDSRQRAERAAKIFENTGAIQFWTNDRALAKAFMKPLGLKRTPAWDVYLAYEKGTEWTDEIPEPDFFMHQLPELPPAARLNGNRFFAMLSTLAEMP